jgi:hypothetical protein
MILKITINIKNINRLAAVRETYCFVCEVETEVFNAGHLGIMAMFKWLGQTILRPVFHHKKFDLQGK